jgi:hypothetical protein
MQALVMAVYMLGMLGVERLLAGEAQIVSHR